MAQTRPDLEDEILDDKSLRVVTARLPHLKQVKTYTVKVADWQRDHSRADAMHQLLAQQVASGVDYINEVAEDPRFRGHVDEFDDRLYGKVLYGTSPLLEDKTPPGRGIPPAAAGTTTQRST